MTLTNGSEETPGFLSVRNARGSSVTLTPFGARIVDVVMPDASGSRSSCVLGFDALDEYKKHVSLYMGPIIGRVAGRTANSHFIGGGLDLDLESNDGPHTLHGGVSASLDSAQWAVEAIEREESCGYSFSLDSPDGAGGYPGNLEVRASYLLGQDDSLTVELSARADRDTPIALTQHAYWNLSSPGSGRAVDDELWIFSNTLIEMTEELVPTGRILDVSGTGFDFTRQRVMSQSLPQGTGQPWPGIDHTYLLNRRQDWMREPVARLVSASRGRRMDVYTTEPHLQVYLGGHLADVPGRDGIVFGPGSGVCLETVRFPDSPLLPGLPSVVVPAGTQYRQTTIYRFTSD